MQGAKVREKYKLEVTEKVGFAAFPQHFFHIELEQEGIDLRCLFEYFFDEDLSVVAIGG